MTIIAIVNLAERLLNQSSSEEQDAPTAPKQAKRRSNSRQVQTVEDRFTSSPQHQADPGLFRVNQFHVFSPAADFLLAQAPLSNADPIATPPAAQANAAPAIPLPSAKSKAASA
jgi:hypothetical protein